MSAPVVVVPLDEDARPVAPATRMTLMDISPRGVGYLGAGGAASPLVLLDFWESGAPGLQMMARVAWCDEFDDFVKVGCEFLHRADEPLPLK